MIISLKVELGEYDDTIALAEEMVKIDPSNEKMFAKIELCYQKLKNYDKAIIFYTKISIKSDFVEAYNMGNALRDQGKFEDALYNQAISVILIILRPITTWVLLSKIRETRRGGRAYKKHSR